MFPKKVFALSALCHVAMLGSGESKTTRGLQDALAPSSDSPGSSKNPKSSDSDSSSDDPDQCVDQAKAPSTVKQRERNHRRITRSLMRRSMDHPSCHVLNGDEERFGADSEFPFIGNFHKTLPHNEHGEVDKDAYTYLVEECIAEADYDACNSVPGVGRLTNTLGGQYVTSMGIPTWSAVTPPPPSIVSAEAAVQYAELMWEALLRDVPFSEYGTNPLVQEAADDLAAMEGCNDLSSNEWWFRPVTPRRRARGGVKIDPETQLFRMDLAGALRGPIVSQFLVHEFGFDGITVKPLMTTAAPGVDMLTDWTNFVTAQNGGFIEGPRRVMDETPRYIRTARDLGMLASSDDIYSVYFRALGVDGLPGFRNPNAVYLQGEEDDRQQGFSTQGKARIYDQLAGVVTSESHAFFEKWNTHRYLRPEAYGGLAHLFMTGEKDYPLHPSLKTSLAMEKVFEKFGTYLLPQLSSGGGPTHPSYPAGHAISAGACVTVLKVWMDPHGTECWPNDVLQATPDGLATETLDGFDGEDDCLILNGELNKLAHNLSMGRDMSGVHWRSDDMAGMEQGELVARHHLQDDLDRQPECGQVYQYVSFRGEQVVLRKTNCDD